MKRVSFTLIYGKCVHWGVGGMWLITQGPASFEVAFPHLGSQCTVCASILNQPHVTGNKET